MKKVLSLIFLSLFTLELKILFATVSYFLFIKKYFRRENEKN